MGAVLEALVWGVVASLVASLIWALGALLFSSAFRKRARIQLNRVLDTGVTYVYAKPSEAVDDVRAGFERSTRIRILTLRGSGFLSDNGAFRFLLADRKPSQELLYLGADPAPPGAVDHVARRGDEVQSIDGQTREEFLAEITHYAAVAARLARETPGMQVRLHNSPAVFRLILFDHELFLLFFLATGRLASNQVYRCPGSSELYRAFARYFELIWESAREPDPSPPAADAATGPSDRGGD